MSRIGRKPIVLPKGVSAAEKERVFQVTGPKGSLSLPLSNYVNVKVAGSTVNLERNSEDRQARAHHGLMRALIANMVQGVTAGFEKRLDISGVGFKAEVSSGKLQLNIGYSHPVVYEIPKGIEIAVDKQVKVIVRGLDAQLVGQVAAEIRGFREPDIYKAKGIKYETEVIKTKAGKTGGK